MKDIKLFEIGRFRLSIAWYDLWVGAFISKKEPDWSMRTFVHLYICLIPTVLITLDLSKAPRKCQEEGCKKEALHQPFTIPGSLDNNYEDIQAYFCDEHADGFCPVCHNFYAGENFFDLHGCCHNCASEYREPENHAWSD